MNLTFAERIRFLFSVLFLAVLVIGGFSSNSLDAAEKDDALRPIRQTILKASRFARRNDEAEASKLLKQARTDLDAWKSQFKVKEDDRTYTSIVKLIEDKQADVEKAGDKPEAMAVRTNRNSKVVFSRHVMPILQQNCFSCHDDQAAGGLQLDTLEGMRKGGRGGRLLTPKNARNSLIMQRLISNGEDRMPKDAEPLSRNQLITLNDWIVQGAEIDKFEVAEEKPENTPEKIEVALPTGKETVSFKKDIAPFFARLCLGCHNDQQQRGGLSMSTFQKLLEGGDSGEVLVPGDLENSRLFRLAGGLELPRMPNNNSRLTRKNYEDMKKWIEEGVKYDGGDPNAALTSLLPTEQDLAAERFAKMPEEEFQKHRLEQATTLWKRAGSGKSPTVVETENFLLLGNIPAERLRAAGTWAEETYDYLQNRFEKSERNAWGGRLAIFIVEDRFLHSEFFTYLNKGEPGEFPVGIVEVTASNETAFVEMQDTGNDATGSTPGLPYQLRQLVAEAYLSRGGVKLPSWFRNGMAQYIVKNSTRWDLEKSPWTTNSRRRVLATIKEIAARRQQPGALYTENFFTPAELNLYADALVRMLTKDMKEEQVYAVIKAVRDGMTVQKAFASVGGPGLIGTEGVFISRYQKVAN